MAGIVSAFYGLRNQSVFGQQPSVSQLFDTNGISRIDWLGAQEMMRHELTAEDLGDAEKGPTCTRPVNRGAPPKNVAYHGPKIQEVAITGKVDPAKDSQLTKEMEEELSHRYYNKDIYKSTSLPREATVAELIAQRDPQQRGRHGGVWPHVTQAIPPNGGHVDGREMHIEGDPHSRYDEMARKIQSEMYTKTGGSAQIDPYRPLSGSVLQPGLIEKAEPAHQTQPQPLQPPSDHENDVPRVDRYNSYTGIQYSTSAYFNGTWPQTQVESASTLAPGQIERANSSPGKQSSSSTNFNGGVRQTEQPSIYREPPHIERANTFCGTTQLGIGCSGSTSSSAIGSMANWAQGYRNPPLMGPAISDRQLEKTERGMALGVFEDRVQRERREILMRTSPDNQWADFRQLASEEGLETRAALPHLGPAPPGELTIKEGLSGEEDQARWEEEVDRRDNTRAQFRGGNPHYFYELAKDAGLVRKRPQYENWPDCNLKPAGFDRFWHS